jgi:hypothetical protein
MGVKLQLTILPSHFWDQNFNPRWSHNITNKVCHLCAKHLRNSIDMYGVTMYEWLIWCTAGFPLCPPLSKWSWTFEFSIKYYMNDFMKSLSIFLVMYCSISSILLLLLGDQVKIACVLCRNRYRTYHKTADCHSTSNCFKFTMNKDPKGTTCLQKNLNIY